MVPHTLTYKPLMIHSPLGSMAARQVEKLIRKLIPHPGTLLAGGLILAGWGIPLCMLLGSIPATLLLGFAGLALTATGSLLFLIYLGDI